VKASHSSDGFTVLLVQNKPKRSLTENLKHLEKLLSAAKLGEADLVVLPEFIFEQRKSQRWLAETLSFFRLFCRKNSVNAVAGSIPEKETGSWYNTAFLIDGKGELIGKYRKMHLGPLEGEFSEGDTVGIFSIDGVKIGVGICRDLWFPEYWRVLKKRGAVLFAVTSCIEKPEWEGSLSMARARAVENQVFLALCNNPQSGVGRSCVIKYDASIMATLNDKPGTLLADLDLAQAEEWRNKIGYKRRTDIYDIIEKHENASGERWNE